jgi:hypothetical protein
MVRDLERELTKKEVKQWDEFFIKLGDASKLDPSTMATMFKAMIRVWGIPEGPPDDPRCVEDSWGEIFVEARNECLPAPADCRCGFCNTLASWAECEAGGQS